MGGTSRQTRLFTIDSPGATSERAPRIFDVIAVMFAAFLLISNVAAAKVTALGAGPIHLVLDEGVTFFPSIYVLGDVLSEVYGFTWAKRVITLGFIISVPAPLTFLFVQVAPIGPGYENQAASEAVLDFAPRIVAASVVGYLVGQLVNSFVLVKIRQCRGAERLWVRPIGSTLFGEVFDTVPFCTIAFMGIIPGCDFFNYMLIGYVYKVGVEVVLFPITYHMVALVGKHEGPKPEEVLAA